MKKITLLSTAMLGVMFTLLLHATPAQAQNPHTYVASNGSGPNCTLLAPCDNFQTAHDSTAPRWRNQLRR